MAAVYTPLSVKIGTDEVSEYYPQILHRLDLPDNDNVLIAVARMLLTGDRAQEKTQYCNVVNYSSMLIDGKLSKETVVGETSVFRVMRQGIWFTFFANDESEKEIEALKSYEGEYKKLGWEPLADIARYIDNTGKTLVYQNNDRHAVEIVTKASNAIKTVHMAASAFSRLLPWYFENAPLTQNEIEMLKALYEGHNMTFESFANKYYKEQSFEEKRLIKMLDGFCKIDYSDVIAELNQDIENCRDNITDFYRKIREYQDTIERKQIDVMIYRNKSTDAHEAEDRFIQYLKSNSSVNVLSRNDRSLRLGITCNLDDYDETVFHTYVENPQTSNYIYEASPFNREITKRFLTAVWKEHRWGLRVFCEWKLYEDCSFEAIKHSNMGGRDDLKANRIPQYHIDSYRCFGGWEAAMNECRRNRDYEGLVNLFVASSHSINWGDSTVVGNFMNKIWSDLDLKIFEDKDGTLWSVKEIMAQLEKEAAQPESEQRTHKKRERPAANDV